MTLGSDSLAHVENDARSIRLGEYFLRKRLRTGCLKRRWWYKVKVRTQNRLRAQSIVINEVSQLLFPDYSTSINPKRGVSNVLCN